MWGYGQTNEFGFLIIFAFVAGAHTLWSLAAAQGHEGAIKNLKILEMEMKKNMTKNATKNTK